MGNSSIKREDGTVWNEALADRLRRKARDGGSSSSPTIPVRLDLADHLIDALLAIGDHAGAEEIRAALRETKG